MADERTPRSGGHESNIAIYASIGANVLIAATKFVAATVTGSSAMIAEGVHSTVNCADGSLLLLGRHRSRRPPDETHPFGHGKELYFWTLIVAMVFFALGGGMSIYEGIKHIIEPERISDPTWNYIVLGVAAVIDGISFMIAFRQLRRRAGSRGPVARLLSSKDPTLFTVLLEDTGDLIGISIAFLGVYFSHRLGNPYIDAGASITIGLLLAAMALYLANQSRGLLVGESADAELVHDIRSIATRDAAVRALRPPLTMHLGPHTVLSALEIDFHDDLSSEEVARAVQRLEAELRTRRPELKHLFIEAGCFADRSRRA
jgi:cation diffusion facilitator family transporter